MGNSIWINKNTKEEIKDDYKKTLINKYDSVIEKIYPDEVNILNDWINKKTNNTIKDPIQELDSLFLLALVNVIYFKDDWKDKFEDSNSEFEFTQFNGEKINLP